MEKQTRDETTATKTNPGSVPRAIVHKQILNVAQAQPDATMEDIAERVDGATIRLVEQVLDEYGDPGRETESADSHSDSPGSDELDKNDDEHLSMSDQNVQNEAHSRYAHQNLTDKQLETLKTIYDNPEETQAEIAERLDVSKSTINTRVNSIDGFEWTTRKQFVESMFENNGSPSGGNESSQESSTEIREELDQIASQMKTIEHHLERQTNSSQSALDNPDLAHKVVHACIASDLITEDEELLLLEEIMS